MLGKLIEYIDTHPRLILMTAWPVLSAFLAWLIWIVWKGPWITRVDVQHQQLQILGSIAFGILGVFALNMLAQSMNFFGKLGVKLGNIVDVNADANNSNSDLRDK